MMTSAFRPNSMRLAGAAGASPPSSSSLRGLRLLVRGAPSGSHAAVAGAACSEDARARARSPDVVASDGPRSTGAGGRVVERASKISPWGAGAGPRAAPDDAGAGRGAAPAGAARALALSRTAANRSLSVAIGVVGVSLVRGPPFPTGRNGKKQPDRGGPGPPCPRVRSPVPRHFFPSFSSSLSAAALRTLQNRRGGTLCVPPRLMQNKGPDQDPNKRMEKKGRTPHRSLFSHFFSLSVACFLFLFFRSSLLFFSLFFSFIYTFLMEAAIPRGKRKDGGATKKAPQWPSPKGRTGRKSGGGGEATSPTRRAARGGGNHQRPRLVAPPRPRPLDRAR